MNAISPGEALFIRELIDGIEADREADWWRRHSDLVISGGGIAVYLEANNDNITVIRQRAEPVDARICIPPDQLSTLIDRLKDLFDDD
jgi:hypothetical protein